MRPSEFPDEAFDGVIGAAETVVGHQVLPDRHSIAATAKPFFDDFPEWLAGTGRRARFGQLSGRFSEKGLIKSVATPAASMAGFDSERRPGPLTVIPAAFR